MAEAQYQSKGSPEDEGGSEMTRIQSIGNILLTSLEVVTLIGIVFGALEILLGFF